MVGDERRQRGVARPVQTNAVRVAEVRVLAGLAPLRLEPDGARLLVEPQQLHHRPLAGCDVPLQRPGGEVVEVDVAPIVALGVPEHFAGTPENLAPDPRLVLRGDLLAHDRADRAGGRIGHSQHGFLVVAGGRDEGELPAVRAPLPVIQAHVVSERGAVIVRRHLQAHHLSSGGVDNDAVEHRDHRVAGQREFRDAERRVRDGGNGRVDEVHLADLALVLLVGGDLLRVRRPEHDGAIAAAPAGVVGGVAEVLLAVGGELAFLAGGEIADPQVPVADERRRPAVGRRDVDARLPAPALAPGGGGLRHRTFGARLGAPRAQRVAAPPLAVQVERDRLHVRREGERPEGERVSRVRALRRGRECRRQPRVVEGRPACPGDRIDEDELVSVGNLVAVPKGVAGQPVRRNLSADDERIDRGRQEALGAGVIGRRERSGAFGPTLLPGRRAGRGKHAQQDQARQDAARRASGEMTDSAHDVLA